MKRHLFLIMWFMFVPNQALSYRKCHVRNPVSSADIYYDPCDLHCCRNTDDRGDCLQASEYCAWDDNLGCFARGSCAFATSSQVCSTLEECLWTGKKCRMRSSPMPCNEWDTSELCRSNDCTWDDDNGCLSLEAASCPRAKKEGSCALIGHCTWTGALCLPQSETQCRDFSTPTDCERNACHWNPHTERCKTNAWETCQALLFDQRDELGDLDESICVNRATADCDIADDQSKCENLKRCTWDDASGCLPPTSSSCMRASSGKTCSSTGSCTWTGKNCIVSPFWSSCGTWESAETCEAVKCLWDDNNGCFSNWFDRQPLATSESVCHQIPGSSWSGTACLDHDRTRCHVYKLAKGCSRDPGCAWEPNEARCVDLPQVEVSILSGLAEFLGFVVGGTFTVFLLGLLSQKFP